MDLRIFYEDGSTEVIKEVKDYWKMPKYEVKVKIKSEIELWEEIQQNYIDSVKGNSIGCFEGRLPSLRKNAFIKKFAHPTLDVIVSAYSSPRELRGLREVDRLWINVIKRVYMEKINEWVQEARIKDFKQVIILSNQ